MSLLCGRGISLRLGLQVVFAAQISACLTPLLGFGVHTLEVQGTQMRKGLILVKVCQIPSIWACGPLRYDGHARVELSVLRSEEHMSAPTFGLVIGGLSV